MQVEIPEGPQGPPQEERPPSPEFAFSPPAPPAQRVPSPTLLAGPGSPLRASLGNPSEMRAAKAAGRRRAAAEFVEAQTGIRLPAESDLAFRAALRDGVALCRLLNALRPGTVGKIMDHSQAECSSPTGDVIRSFENVANFISASQALTGGSEAFVCLSAADLEDAGERPVVADCILSLQAWWQAQQAEAAGLRASASWPRPASAGGSGAASVSPSGVPPAAATPPPLRTPPSPTAPPSEFSFTPHAAAAVHRATGQQRQDGLEYLMRTCNHMLKSSMGMPATPLPPPPRTTAGVPPEIALDAVGPVLETVLQNLTAEYEKRLLAKDQEFKLGQEAQERMRRDIARLKQEVAHWKEQAANVQYLPAPGMTDAEKEEAARQIAEAKAEAVAKEAAAAAEVARKEEELRLVQEEAAEKVAEAEQQLGELSQEVQQYRDLNERYRQISEENRQLYNTVQDLRGNIRVFCRVRPRGRTGDASACMVEVGEEGTVNVFSQKHSKWHNFRFDRVFAEGSTQDDVYAETQPLIRSVLDGYNVCIFAYGQTGSGKTHTMSGTDIGEYANRGINYRALDDLFELNRQRSLEVEYSIKVQLLEIYNETIRDLLVPEAEAKQQRPLALKNLERSGLNVPDAIQVPVACTEDVLEVMDRGQRNRAVAETRMNDRSSRSHQVLTVMVEGSNKITHARTHGCLHLIDLAGSERVGKSGAEGQQLLEAQHINKSLSALGNVMHALASKNAHVPFRDSKLTQLLQDSLSGQAKTMMFMHVAPEMNSVSETLSTLNFGKNVTEITLGAAKRNAESGAAWEAKERAIKAERDTAAVQRALAAEQEKSAALQAEVEALRAQLAKGGSSSGGGPLEEEGGIRAYRPSTSWQGGSGGLTPRSRLSQQSSAAVPPLAAAAAAGRATPRGGAAPASGLTPRSGSVGTRPPQVSRLPLGGSGGKEEGRRLSGPGSSTGLRPPMARLNLAQLQRADSEENRSPLSARSGTTPRSARRASPGSSTNWLVDASDSDVGSPGQDSSPAGLAEREAAAAAAAAAAEPGSEADAAEEEAEVVQQMAALSPPRPLSSRGPPPPRPGAAAPTAGGRPGVPRLSLAGGGRPSQPAATQQQARASTGAAPGRRLSQGAGSRIPVPSPSPPPAAALRCAPSGSLTARPSTQHRSPTLSSSIPRGPLSARESPAEAAARRAALQQRASSSGTLRRSVAGTDAASMRRSVSGPADAGPPNSARGTGSNSSGTLNSARGMRSSTTQIPAATRRWA